mgnify:FL=1
MTREDVAKLIRMNFVLYKLGSKPLTDEEMQTTIDVWAYQFGDYDGDTVKRAFLAANRVCVYPVTVADIFRQLSQSIDPVAEWDKLAEAARQAQEFLSWRSFPKIVDRDAAGHFIRSDGRMELADLYESLPAAAKSYAGSVNGLIELARTPDLTYRRAEFLKQVREDISTAPAKAIESRKSQEVLPGGSTAGRIAAHPGV